MLCAVGCVTTLSGPCCPHPQKPALSPSWLLGAQEAAWPSLWVWWSPQAHAWKDTGPEGVGLSPAELRLMAPSQRLFPALPQGRPRRPPRWHHSGSLSCDQIRKRTPPGFWGGSKPLRGGRGSRRGRPAVLLGLRWGSRHPSPPSVVWVTAWVVPVQTAARAPGPARLSGEPPPLHPLLSGESLLQGPATGRRPAGAPASAGGGES